MGSRRVRRCLGTLVVWLVVSMAAAAAAPSLYGQGMPAIDTTDGTMTPMTKDCEVYPEACEPEGPTFAVSVTPDGVTTADRPANSGVEYSQTFTVFNQGSQSGTFLISCSSTEPATCTRTSTSSVLIAKGGKAFVTAYYTVGNPGSGRLTLSAIEEAWDSGYVTVPVVTPPDAPSVSLAPHNENVTDYSTCLASCFAVLWSHTTPAYFSLDTPRSFQLVYNSATAAPTPVVQADVTPPSNGVPTSYSAELRLASTNSLLTLLNGQPAVYYAASAATTRLAVAFDARANGLSTGIHDVKLTVTAHSASGVASTTILTTVVVVDRSRSIFGTGFWPAGVQQRIVSGTNTLIIEGDGSTYVYKNGATPGGTSARLSGNRRIYLDGSYVEFRADGRMQRAVDRFGNATEMQWIDTLLVRIVDPMNKGITVNYGMRNGMRWKIEGVSDDANRTTSYGADDAGHLTRITDPDGISSWLAYFPSGLLHEAIRRGPQEHVWSYGYDGINRLSQIDAAAIPLVTGSTARPSTLLIASERRVWDGPAGTSAANAKFALQPDSVPALLIDPLGVMTSYWLDRFGAPVRITDALGRTTTIVRDTMARPTLLTESNGHRVQYAYGGSTGAPPAISPYLLWKVTDLSVPRGLTYSYNSRNDVTTVLGGAARQDFHYYGTTTADGPAGALAKVYVGNTATYPGVTSGLKPVSTYFYDSRGRPTRAVDAADMVTTYTYDAVWGNLQSTTNARGFTTRTHFDQFGRADSTYAPGNIASGVSYGLLNEVTRARNPLGHVTETRYNADGTVARIIDPMGQEYRFGYNALGLPVTAHDLADPTRADSIKYDAAGRVRVAKNRRGNAITLTYDVLGRLVSRTAIGVQDTFAYDTAGRWMVAQNGTARDSVAYDLAGRVTGWTQTLLVGQSPPQSHSWSYEYDSRDRVIDRDLAIGGLAQSYGSQTRTYDTKGTLTSTWTPGVKLTFQYDARLQGIQRVVNEGQPGGWAVTRAYNEVGDAGRDEYSPPGLDARFGGEFGYDSLGQLSRRDGETFESGAQYAGWAYRYDDAGQLTQACRYPPNVNFFAPFTCKHEYGGSSVNDRPYRYDAAGNRTDPAASAVIDPGNRVRLFKGWQYHYDADGNIWKRTGYDQTWLYTWNALGQLTEVRRDDQVQVAFQYDAFGRRVVRSGTIAGTWERLTYDGEQLVLVTDQAGVRKELYNWLPGTDQLMSMEQGGVVGVAITDPVLGATVRGFAHASGGGLIKEYSQGPWGSIGADSGMVTRFRLGGAQFDREIGLIYMRARYYDPTLGRFISEDPIGVAGGLNLYAYAGNDPINTWDPSGTSQECELWGVVETGYVGDEVVSRKITRTYTKCYPGLPSGGGQASRGGKSAQGATRRPTGSPDANSDRVANYVWNYDGSSVAALGVAECEAQYTECSYQCSRFTNAQRRNRCRRECANAYGRCLADAAVRDHQQYIMPGLERAYQSLLDGTLRFLEMLGKPHPAMYPPGLQGFPVLRFR